MSDLALPFVSRKQLSFGEATSFQLIINYKTRKGTGLLITGATKNGIFRYFATSVPTGVFQTSTFSIPDIPIWVTVSPSAQGFASGEAYASIYLGIGQNRMYCLAAGYIYGLQDISWKNSLQRPAVRLPMGRLFQQTIGGPGAGTETLVTVPANQFWKVKALAFTLATGPAAPTRLPSFIFAPVSGNDIVVHADAAVGALATTIYSVAHHQITSAAIDNGVALVSMPDEILMPTGSTITTITRDLDANDEWTLLSVIFEQSFQDN
jgi:hypothetical protein